MIEKACNLWIASADYRCIHTSGATDDDGAILDFGVAREAVSRFAGVAGDLGRLITARGNHVHLIRPGLVSFPVKQYVVAASERTWKWPRTPSSSSSAPIGPHPQDPDQP